MKNFFPGLRKGRNVLHAAKLLAIAFLADCTLVKANELVQRYVQNSARESVKLECRMSGFNNVPGDPARYSVKRMSCQDVSLITDEPDREFAELSCETFIFDPTDTMFKISPDERRYEYYRNAAKSETWKYLDRATGEYRSRHEVKPEFRSPNIFVVREVRGICTPFRPKF